MKMPVSPYPSPEPDSPNVPVWTPSQFKGAKKGTKQYRAPESYSLGETIANAVSQGVAAALSIAALVILLVAAVLHGGGVRVFVALAFGVPMLLAFLMSTLYHALPSDTAKQVFRVLGHDFVFLYIAGAITPYCVLLVGDAGGLALCGAEWVLAIVGILIESIWHARPSWVPLALCAVMCGAVLSLVPAISAAIAPAGWWLFVAASICMAFGAVLYVLRSKPYLWFVSHVLVAAGSICLFLSVTLFVI